MTPGVRRLTRNLLQAHKRWDEAEHPEMRHLAPYLERLDLKYHYASGLLSLQEFEDLTRRQLLLQEQT